MKRTFEITSGIEVYATAEGESIEQKMRKLTTSKEPIENVAPLIYTERKDGVLPQFDHRTDRFELARQATDRVFATRTAMIKAAQDAAAEAAKQAAEAAKRAASEEVQTTNS